MCRAGHSCFNAVGCSFVVFLFVFCRHNASCSHQSLKGMKVQTNMRRTLNAAAQGWTPITLLLLWRLLTASLYLAATKQLEGAGASVTRLAGSCRPQVCTH